MTRNIAVVAVLLLSVVGAASLEAENIGSQFAGKEPVKVYIKSVTNESGKSEVEPDKFRKSLEKIFSERKALRFAVVKSPSESDIQVEAIIKNFNYLNRGPLKSVPVMGLSIVDAAATATQNYVEIGVEYAVIATNTGQVLWKSGLADYLKRVMTAEESLPLIYDKIARVFLWKCFGKSRGTEISTR